MTLLLLVSACNPAKYVPEGKQLLHYNDIVIEKDSSSTGYVSVSDLEPILKQRPNRKVLRTLKLHLWIYNRSNQERIDRIAPKKQEKAAKKNEKIIAYNNRVRIHNRRIDSAGTNKKYRQEKELKERKIVFGEWLQRIGEAPVIIDTNQVERGRNQLSLYMSRKGYFENTVKDTVYNAGKKRLDQKQKAVVKYTIVPGSAWLFNDFTYTAKEKGVMEYLDKFYKENTSLIQRGKNFDIDLMDSERNKIANYMLLNGFYNFRKDYILFEADSLEGTHKINILLKVTNPKTKEVLSETMKETPHIQYYINSITVKQNTHEKGELISLPYTDKGQECIYVFIDEPEIKPKVLHKNILFSKGELYNSKKVENTYRRLSSLGAYKTTRIQFFPSPDGDSLIDAVITLETAKSQTISLEASGINNAGLLGVRGSINYSHRNIFGGAENLRISLSGGVEAQRSIVESNETNQTVLDELGTTFNTAEFGPSMVLTIPRFLFTERAFSNFYNTKTEFTAKVNYQRRPDFTRGIEELTYSYTWKTKPSNFFRFNLAEISAVEISKKSAAFESQINNLNDRLLAASFSDHIIAGSGFMYEYSNRDQRSGSRNFVYYRGMFETAGNTLRAIYSLTNQPLGSLGGYELFGIRFAQYVKMWHDFRYYRIFSNKHSTVYRVAGGVGVPLANLSEALPFEKSFFSGGANGMRAWRARTLGPGSFRDPNRRFDKIGDIQLEGNIEYRFDVVGKLKGAFFVDAGNIWQLKVDTLRPGGNFDPKRFISEIALGTGVGVRYDLDFFIVRLDFAIPIKNPAMDRGGRFIWQASPADKKDFYRLQFNLGIGYPF